MQLQALVSVCLLAAVVMVTDVQASATADLSTLKDTKSALQHAQAAVEDLQQLLYNDTLTTIKLTSAGTTGTGPGGNSTAVPDTTTEPGTTETGTTASPHTTTASDTTTEEPHTTTLDSTISSDTITESSEMTTASSDITTTSGRSTAEPDTTTTLSDTTTTSDTTSAEPDTTLSVTTTAEPDSTMTSDTTTAEPDTTTTLSDTTTTSDTTSAEPDTTTSVTTTAEPDSTMTDTSTSEPDTTTTSDTTTAEPDTTTTFDTTSAKPETTTSVTTTAEPDSTMASDTTTAEPDTITTSDTTTTEPDSTTTFHTTTEDPDTKTTSETTTAETDSTTAPETTTAETDTTTAEPDSTTALGTTTAEPYTTSGTNTADPDSTTTSDIISTEPDTTTSVTTTTEPDSTTTSDQTTTEPDTTTTSVTTTEEPDTTATSHTTTEEPETTTTIDTTTAEPDSTTAPGTTTTEPYTTTSDTSTAETDSTTTSDMISTEPDTTTSVTTTAEPGSTTVSDTTTAEPDSTTASDLTTAEPDATSTTDTTLTAPETTTAKPDSTTSPDLTIASDTTTTSPEIITTTSGTTPTAEPVSSSSPIPSESIGSTKLTSTSAESSSTSTEVSNPSGATTTTTTTSANTEEAISTSIDPSGPGNSQIGNFGALFLQTTITPSLGTTTLHSFTGNALEMSVSVSNLQRFSANSQSGSLHGVSSTADELTRNASSSSSTVQTKVSGQNERNERSEQNKGTRHLLSFDKLPPGEKSVKTNPPKSVIKIMKVNPSAKKLSGGSSSNEKLSHDRESLAKPSATEENSRWVPLGKVFIESKGDTAQFHSHDTDYSRLSRTNSITKGAPEYDEEDLNVPYIMNQVQDADDDKTIEKQIFVQSVPDGIFGIAKKMIFLRGSVKSKDMLSPRKEEVQHQSFQEKDYSQLEKDKAERFNYPFDPKSRIKRAIRVDLDKGSNSNHTSWQQDVEQTLGEIQQLTYEIAKGAIEDSVAKELDTASSTLDDLVMEASVDPSLVLDHDGLTEMASNVTRAMEEALMVVEIEIDDAQHDVNVMIAVVVVLSVLFVAMVMGLLLAFTRPWSKRCTLPGQKQLKKKRSPDLIDDSSPSQAITISTKSYVSHSDSDFVTTYQGSISNSITFAGSQTNLNHKDGEEAYSKNSKKAAKNGSSIAMTSIRYTGDFMDDEVNYGKTGAVVDLNPWQSVKIANSDHGVHLARNGSGLRSSSQQSHDESFREDSNGGESKGNDARKNSLSSDVETNGNVFITDSDNGFIRNGRYRGSGNSNHEPLDLQLHIIEGDGNDC